MTIELIAAMGILGIFGLALAVWFWPSLWRTPKPEPERVVRRVQPFAPFGHCRCMACRQDISRQADAGRARANEINER